MMRNKESDVFEWYFTVNNKSPYVFMEKLRADESGNVFDASGKKRVNFLIATRSPMFALDVCIRNYSLFDDDTQLLKTLDNLFNLCGSIDSMLICDLDIAIIGAESFHAGSNKMYELLVEFIKYKIEYFENHLIGLFPEVIKEDHFDILGKNAEMIPDRKYKNQRRKLLSIGGKDSIYVEDDYNPGFFGYFSGSSRITEALQ